jgi:hypothetical protein
MEHLKGKKSSLNGKRLHKTSCFKPEAISINPKKI